MGRVWLREGSRERQSSPDHLPTDRHRSGLACTWHVSSLVTVRVSSRAQQEEWWRARPLDLDLNSNLTPPLPSSVALGKLFSLSKSVSSSVKWGLYLFMWLLYGAKEIIVQ